MTDAAEPRMPPQATVLNLLTGKWISQAVYAAAALGVPDALREGALSIDELAPRVNADPNALGRLLRVLVSVGVLAETQSGFALTPVGECLRTDVPGSVRAIALTFGHRATWLPWGELLHSVRTGKPAFDQVHGGNLFEVASRDADMANLLNSAMAATSTSEGQAIATSYDFSKLPLVVDVGGGVGALLAAILERNPSTQGVLFEVPQVADIARQHLQRADLSPRCKVQSGSFFEAVPEGADGYVLKNVLHDWDDERARLILTNCRKAAGAHPSKLLIVEAVIPDDNGPSFAKLYDLEMLVITGGRERTRAEYSALLSASGWKLTGVFPTPAPLAVLEAVPA